MNQSPLIDSFVLPRRGLGFRDPILDGNLEMILVFACWISRERERQGERGREGISQGAHARNSVV